MGRSLLPCAIDIIFANMIIVIKVQTEGTKQASSEDLSVILVKRGKNDNQMPQVSD